MEKPEQDIRRGRPTLTDPKEFATIREIYFGDIPGSDIPTDSELMERIERFERRQRTKKKSSR